MHITKTQEMVYELKVADVMTRDVIAALSKDRMTILRSIFQRKRFSGLPVLEQDKLVGLISLEDFIQWLGTRQDDGLIEDHMTRDVTTVYDDAPLVVAIRKFDKTGLGRFPVVDRYEGRLVGILTEGEVVKGLLRKLEMDFRLLMDQIYSQQ